MGVKISACTITKNEEKNIARSIESYKDYVDEIIIVDTGSTDDTVKIAESLGAKVIHFEWINDFSAAKNCALNAAKGDWILFLDADEWIKDNGAMKLQSIIKQAIAENLDAISLRMFNLSDDGTVMETNSSLRIFANKPHIRYTRKIHEHLFDSIKNTPLLSLKIDEVSLNHSGYAESITKTKLKRNKELLEKNYMNGSLEAIDYFYLAREMIFDYPEYSRQFLDMLIKDEVKFKQASKLDLANNIHEVKIKLTKLMEGKYSFEEKLEIIEDAIKTFPNDPMYYYYKYDLFINRGELEYENLLTKIVALDSKYEKEVLGNNNVFARYRADVFLELGKLSLLRNDTLKAMEYFVLSIQNGGRNGDSLKGLLSIINSQALSEKITFLNSLYDISKEENLEFLVQSLRLSPYTDVFLYYFVKYYKDFGKVDIALFTSMMLNQKFEEVAEKYLNILINENDYRAENLIAAAIIMGELKEFYENNKNYLSGYYRRFLSSYFNDSVIDNIQKEDLEVAERVIVEILNLDSEDKLDKIKNIFNNDERILKIIVKDYYANRENKKVIKEINKFIDNDLSDEFAGEITGILGECYFSMGDSKMAFLYLQQAVEVGFLNKNIALLLDSLKVKLDMSDEIKIKVDEYKYLFKKFVESVKYINYEKISDSDANKAVSSIEKFEEQISITLNLVDSVKNSMFNYANKLFEMNNVYAAEEYYKILIRCNFNLGKVYYKLGKIYNKIGAINLSYYCYDKAFRTSIEFPREILSEKHENRNYIYNIQNVKNNEICPICGKNANLNSCYEYIEDENISKDSVLIVKYRKCDECNHIFAENFREMNHFDKSNNKEANIFNAYDISEKLETEDKIVVIDNSDILYEVLSKDFDTINIEHSLEYNRELGDIFGQLSQYEDRKVVMVINNIESDFEKYQEIPLWATVDIVNAYSKKSISKLLTDNGYNNIKIFNSKYLKGKMIVIANK